MNNINFERTVFNTSNIGMYTLYFSKISAKVVLQSIFNIQICINDPKLSENIENG